MGWEWASPVGAYQLAERGDLNLKPRAVMIIETAKAKEGV